MNKNEIPNKLLWDEEPLTSKDAIKFILCWASCLPFKVVCIPSETPLERTKFPFMSFYQLEISSGFNSM